MAARREERSARSLAEVARFAGLALDETRLEALVPQLLQLMARLERVRALDLTEVEPAFITPLPGG